MLWMKGIMIEFSSFYEHGHFRGKSSLKNAENVEKVAHDSLFLNMDYVSSSFIWQ